MTEKGERSDLPCREQWKELAGASCSHVDDSRRQKDERTRLDDDDVLE